MSESASSGGSRLPPTMVDNRFTRPLEFAMPLWKRIDGLSGLLAALVFIVSVAVFGASLEGYSQSRHPVALLGASGVPHALAFNLLGWVLPGLLATAVALRVLVHLPVASHWSSRVAGQLLLLAGMAFAGMGLLPLDVEALEGPASQAHASAWMVWALAFVAGTLMFGVSIWRRWPALGALAIACGMVAALGGFALQGVVPAPLAQRVAFASWAAWLALVLPVMRARGDHH